MRNASNRSIVVRHAHRHGFCMDHLRHADNISENILPLGRDTFAARVALSGVVISNNPGSAVEQAGLRVLPTGLGRTRHGVATHVAWVHVAVNDELADFGLHRDDVRKTTARGVFLNSVKNRGHCIHGHRDNDERLVFLRAAKNGGEVIGDVKALLHSNAGTGRGVVVAVHRMVACGEVTQQGTTNEAEADNADGALNILRTHGDNCGTTRLI